MMKKAIEDFPKQFAWEPAIENAANYTPGNRFTVVGMGGSALAVQLVQAQQPSRPLSVRKNYGLPPVSDEELRQTTIIASSYSGNTEETIDGFHEALEKKLSLIAIAVGGKLIELAEKHKVPYIQLPSTGIQPRSSLGFQVMAFLKVLGDKAGLQRMRRLTDEFEAKELEAQGKDLAKALRSYSPVIYASDQNSIIAYNWKIKINETGKIPAFHNTFPELNHNEMTGFDAQGATKRLCDPFAFVFLKDENDHPAIQKRMEVTQRLYEDRRLPVHAMFLAGKDYWHKAFSSLLIADWTAYYLGEHYGIETEKVPMVEELKGLIAKP